MDPLTMALLATAASGAKFGAGVIGNSAKQQQAARVARAQNRANDLADFNRARQMAYRDDLMIKRHNYAVDRYNEFIPRAMTRAGQAYADNNAVLKELIDQYQFMGQDRLAADVATRGTMAARGMTGRGAQLADVAQSSALGRGDALIANNLLRARYGTERANERIRTQLIDVMQQAYNKVGYTPERTPGGMLMQTPDVQSAFTGQDAAMANAVGAFDAVASGIGMFMGMSGGAGATPKSPYSTQGIEGLDMNSMKFANPSGFQPIGTQSFGTAPNLKLPTFGS